MRWPSGPAADGLPPDTGTPPASGPVTDGFASGAAMRWAIGPAGDGWPSGARGTSGASSSGDPVADRDNGPLPSDTATDWLSPPGGPASGVVGDRDDGSSVRARAVRPGAPADTGSRSGRPTQTPTPPGVGTPAASTCSRPVAGVISGTVTREVPTARSGAIRASVTVHPACRSSRRTSAAAARSESADPLRPRVGTRPEATIAPLDTSTTSVVALPTSIPATTLIGKGPGRNSRGASRPSPGRSGACRPSSLAPSPACQWRQRYASTPTRWIHRQPK